MSQLTLRFTGNSMNLYRQSLDNHGPVGDPELLMQSDSVGVLKAEAERIATSDGCLEFAWLWAKDSSPPLEFPLELDVTGTYRLLIRNW